jgi:glutamate synthase (ferredoxin)
MFGFAVWQLILGFVAVVLLIVLIYDLTQRGSAVLRIFPILGHARYFLIEIGPELRQYLVAGDREELPFDRTEREWIYNSSERKNNYLGFGTNDQPYGIGYPIIKHSMFPYGEEAFTGSKQDKKVQIPCAKVIGEAHGRKRPYRPTSIINISAMSYGSLGRNAISALNQGAKMANCFHNTGEGGCSKYHRFGADICLQLGTGYFGARDLEGRFVPDKLKQTLE